MNKFTVLVVEDDPAVRNLITTTLETHESSFQEGYAAKALEFEKADPGT